jgi:hypothetical protein
MQMLDSLLRLQILHKKGIKSKKVLKQEYCETTRYQCRAVLREKPRIQGFISVLSRGEQCIPQPKQIS